MLIVPTIHEYRKANIVEATDLVVQEAIKLGLVPLDFNVTLRITDKSSITGGVDKHGTPRITMSTHDRYHNVHNYIQSWMFSRNMKKSWLLAAQEYRNTGRCTSVEYASFTQDKEIGNIYTDNNWLVLLSATCHEVAHAITISNHRTHPMTSTKPKPHGVEWKDVYRVLRNALVNPMLKTDTVTPPTTVKPVKPAKTIRAKKPVRKDGIKSTREGSVMYAIIQALLIGGTIKQLAETCGVQKGNISASVNSHIPKKGYVIRLKDGVYKITNATKVW